MLDEEKLQRTFENNQEKVEERINKKYHTMIKEIKESNVLERENIKQGILTEMYYKEGFLDGVEYVMDKIKKSTNNC